MTGMSDVTASSASCVLAFDVGGTWVKHGLVDAAGRVTDAGRIATGSAADGPALLQRLLEVAAPHVAHGDVRGVAFSTLGIIDTHEGRLVGAAEAIEGYFGQSPKASFETAFGLPVVVENDANCVALAEGWTGAAAGLRHYLALTLGTGIGGGIVVDGRLYRGAHGAAGEWGYMLLDGRVWEDHASLRGLAVAAQAARPGCGFDARAVYAASDAGDAQMAEVVARWLGLLATGIANLIVAFDPARVVIGGGIAARGPAFIDELRAELHGRRLRPEFQGVELALASAGNEAGLLGAARLWLLRHDGANDLARDGDPGGEPA
jgi:predicted NBD/HSP70 family sugar kinase